MEEGMSAQARVAQAAGQDDTRQEGRVVDEDQGGEDDINVEDNAGRPPPLWLHDGLSLSAGVRLAVVGQQAKAVLASGWGIC
jgi:hypothetical protein